MAELPVMTADIRIRLGIPICPGIREFVIPGHKRCSLITTIYICCMFPVLFLSSPGPSSEPSVMESKDRKANAHLILKLMCDSVILRPYLRELLSAKYALRLLSPLCSCATLRSALSHLCSAPQGRPRDDPLHAGRQREGLPCRHHRPGSRSENSQR